MSGQAQFNYNDTDFVRTSVTIKLPIDVEGNTEEITFREFSKLDFEAFVSEVFNVVMLENPDEKDETKQKRKDFGVLAKETSGPICKWLARASGKETKFFDTLQKNVISTYGFGNLLRILTEINHVEEILATGGNLSMLPVLSKMIEEQRLQESKSLPTTEA